MSSGMTGINMEAAGAERQLEVLPDTNGACMRSVLRKAGVAAAFAAALLGSAAAVGGRDSVAQVVPIEVTNAIEGLIHDSAFPSRPTTQPAATRPAAATQPAAPLAPAAPFVAPQAGVSAEAPTVPVLADDTDWFGRDLPLAGGVAAVPALPPTPPAPAAPSTRPTAPAAPAAPAVPAAPRGADLLENLGADGRINLLVGKTLLVKSKAPYKRIAVTQPEVLADNEIDATSILLTAKKPGLTQLIVWDDKEHSQVVDVAVDVDMAALETNLKRTFPDAAVQVSVAAGSIVLRGRVPNVTVAEQVAELAAPFGKVMNFLEVGGGQQVMLQVRIAEVSRSASTALGVNFGLSDGTGHFASNNPGGGPFNVGAAGTGNLTRSAGAAVTVFGGGQIGSTAFDVFVSALRQNNLLRVLAEPNLTAISGQEASFLAGGEFPIPVPQAGGSGNATITVEYKQFGVRLNFVPVVMGDGKIRLKVSPEVSDLDFSRSVTLQGFSIPSLTKRNVTTTVEMSEGQTFAVAGLLNNRVTASKHVVPVLGDIPIVGALFRSVRYERNETELVVLVTPRLVEPLNPSQVPPLPGGTWRYPTEADLFWKRDLGGPGADAAPAAADKKAPARFRGPYGFTAVE